MENTTNNNTLFEANEKATTATRALAGTAELTNVASNIANDIIAELNSNLTDERKTQFVDSKSDSNVLDALINEMKDMDAINIEFLTALDAAVLDNMLKSQQSKRSRAKGKTMTLDNYRAMMIGAIGEMLIRKATGKAKNTINRKADGSIGYSQAEMDAFVEDQESLGKAIRNIQSKKSIFKKAAGEEFNAEDEQWVELCNTEEALKALRIVGARKATKKIDPEALKALFIEIDIANIKVAAARELLASIHALIPVESEEGPEETESDETTELDAE